MPIVAWSFIDEVTEHPVYIVPSYYLKNEIFTGNTYNGNRQYLVVNRVEIRRRRQKI